MGKFKTPPKRHSTPSPLPVNPRRQGAASTDFSQYTMETGQRPPGCSATRGLGWGSRYIILPNHLSGPLFSGGTNIWHKRSWKRSRHPGKVLAVAIFSGKADYSPPTTLSAEVSIKR